MDRERRLGRREFIQMAGGAALVALAIGDETNEDRKHFILQREAESAVEAQGIPRPDYDLLVKAKTPQEYQEFMDQKNTHDSAVYEQIQQRTGEDADSILIKTTVREAVRKGVEGTGIFMLLQPTGLIRKIGSNERWEFYQRLVRDLKSFKDKVLRRKIQQPQTTPQL